MSAYCQEVKKLEGTFDGLELTHVLRNDNNEVDELAKMEIQTGFGPDWCFRLTAPSANNQ